MEKRELKLKKREELKQKEEELKQKWEKVQLEKTATDQTESTRVDPIVTILPDIEDADPLETAPPSQNGSQLLEEKNEDYNSSEEEDTLSELEDLIAKLPPIE